ncbi:glycerophosphoryl diester phosphodiesterase [Exophiala aquamarina CBS 119918]|uniref:glycerophosphodiester phosphodiesterase n=1 Tax=Exophiala aquamarina CBS 119918 TaxID=1182545 RepID=A0A072PP05_9EURO|nr:glycerophosphoryl diester phosphodiesterase [Exophiala aquamarina CBS 119918]KEF61088.1 glycerophosphoryl diester phosphodiesterase [Exophiala aquamarina CBS 119918]
MHSTVSSLAVLAAASSLVAAIPLDRRHYPGQDYLVSLGPRPYYLVHNVSEGALKDKLLSCQNKPVGIQPFSIGHRGGGTLQIPEETVESTLAGARMGAGVLECDISFTSDRGLVCRHSLCDLHTTTDILLRPELAAKCTQPFTPANATADADALCCTSDITTAEFLSLCGKMDGFNASATNVEDYQHGTPSWRTDLYNTCGQVLTYPDWIDLVDSLPGHRSFTPELKTPPAAVPLPFNGYTQAQYARDAVKVMIEKNIDPSRVWLQSFTPADIYLWLNEFPAYGKQAVYLDEDGDAPGNLTVAVNRLGALKASGVNIIAPPINYLLNIGGPNNDTIIPSSYATTAKAVGLDIIAWTFERSGPLAKVEATEEYYYSSIAPVTHYDGQAYDVLNVLAHEIGIIGMFSDWSSTVTYYANCFDL